MFLLRNDKIILKFHPNLSNKLKKSFNSRAVGVRYCLRCCYNPWPTMLIVKTYSPLVKYMLIYENWPSKMIFLGSRNCFVNFEFKNGFKNKFQDKGPAQKIFKKKN